MPTLTTVVLSIKGDTKKVNIQLDDDSNLSIEAIQKYFKKKDIPEQICYYEYDNKIIYIFGYKKGKKGTENKTQLPPPNNNIIMYGDAIVIVSISRKWEEAVPYTIDQWNNFISFINNDNKEDNDDTDDDSEESDDNESDVISDIISEKDVDEEYDETEGLIPDDNLEDDDEPEPVIVVQKKKQAVSSKIDNNMYKEDITRNSNASTSSIRMLCIKNMNFLKELSFTENDIQELEQSIFEAAFDNSHKHYIACNWKSPQFRELYRQVVRNVLSNIHPQSPICNNRLIKRVIEGEFKLHEIPKMTSYEMFPEKWFELKDKQIQREQKILEGNKSRATDQFKCRRCNKRECTYYELQTRSADEPMTLFITCLNCGKEWRQGG